MGATININISPCDVQADGGILDRIDKNIQLLLTNQIKIMTAIDDLKTKADSLQTQVNDLQTSLDNEQAQVQQLLDTNAGVVTDLNNQITTLKEQLANGATAEQISGVADILTNISNSLATTRTDLESTVPDQPATGNGGDTTNNPA